jgi:hypothetical protein
MTNNKTLKIVGSVAVVGTLAAAALLGLGMQDSDASTFLASKVDPEVTTAFNDFIAKYDRSFLTKEEFRARLSNFKSRYEAIKEHNSQPDASY